MKFGLIGETLGHSLSPAIHGRLLSALGLSGTYELIEIPRADLGRRVEELIGALDGFNVTIPYKTAVIPYLAGLSKEAETIGAVNTVVIRGGHGWGHNTDYLGFSRTLDAIGADPAGRDAVVLGTGGAARAVVQCLADRGAKTIAVASRHPESVDASFQSFAAARGAQIISYEDIEKEPGAFLAVNATPCGMFPQADASPLSAAAAGRFAKAVDLIYNPAKTKFLRDARAGGAEGANGLLMLAAQALAAEELWLERSLPAELAEIVARAMEAHL